MTTTAAPSPSGVARKPASSATLDLRRRPRRLRRSAAIRDMVRETRLSPTAVYPLFVCGAKGAPRGSVDPGVYQFRSTGGRRDGCAAGDGVRRSLLFGLPRNEEKDAVGSAADDASAPVRCIRAIRRERPLCSS